MYNRLNFTYVTLKHAEINVNKQTINEKINKNINANNLAMPQINIVFNFVCGKKD